MTVGAIQLPNLPVTPSGARPSLAEAAGIADRYTPASSLSVKRGAVAGVAIGSAYGTVVGAVAGSLGAIGGLGYAGVRLGAGFGLPGMIAGGLVGAGIGVAEEKYLHAGSTVGGLVGMGVGAIVGGITGAVVGLFT